MTHRTRLLTTLVEASRLDARTRQVIPVLQPTDVSFTAADLAWFRGALRSVRP